MITVLDFYNFFSFKFSERDFVGLDKTNSQLCYLSSEADLDDFVSIRKSMLNEHPKFSIMTNLLDAHFYIFEKWVCDYLACNE